MNQAEVSSTCFFAKESILVSSNLHIIESCIDQNLTYTVRELPKSLNKWHWFNVSCIVTVVFNLTKMENNSSSHMKKNNIVILPIVPPNSMTQTSAGPSSPSTGIFATRSTHSWMASVMWGTTYRGRENIMKNRVINVKLW